MGWRTIVITKHAKVSYRMAQVLIQTDDNLLQVPLSDIQILLIATTQVVITSHLMMELARQDVKVIFTDDKKMPIGEFIPYYSNINRNKNILNQVNWEDEKKSQLWQVIVKMKVKNQSGLLAKLKRKKYNGAPAAEDLDLLLPLITINDQTNREAVAARMYFQRLFGTSFNRRNEEDAINAYLNFGYSILLSLISQEICSAGYLTELGIHHDNKENFFNLSSDFIEPFRVFNDEIAFNKADQQEFDFADKLELVDRLNQTIVTNEGETMLSNFIRSFVRKCLNYLSNENQDIPDFEFEI